MCGNMQRQREVDVNTELMFYFTRIHSYIYVHYEFQKLFKIK